MSISYFWNKFIKKLSGKAVRNSNISKKAFVNSGSVVFNSSMDDYSYCGYDCWLIQTKIGKFCSISNNVKIGGPAHPIDWLSTSPVFHAKKNVLNKYFENDAEFDPFKNTVIENDVWIGENAIVKAGVKVSTGAVVGAGSVVTKDIPPYEIWAGNPARFIKKRFDDETIETLLSCKWWEKDENELKKMSSLVADVKSFVEQCKREVKDE